MNRSFWIKLAGAKSKALACTVVAALTVALLFMVCSKDEGSSSTDCTANPTAEACKEVDPCVANPSGPNCSSTSKFCYWGPTATAPASCEPIGGPYCQGSTCSEALCVGDYGTVITDCSNPPTTRYCDYGPPVTVGGETVGGCWSTTASQCNEGGTMVTTCPNYPPPTEGGYCDYGFGNCIPSSQSACNEYGKFKTSCSDAGGYYCDYGQPTQYGNGGCYWKPSITPVGAKCGANDDDLEWANVVTMQACITSNTSNSCIQTPTNPGASGDNAAGCNPLKP